MPDGCDVSFQCCCFFFRSENLKEVFPDPELPGSPLLIEEANYYVFKKKRERANSLLGISQRVADSIPVKPVQ